MKKGRLEIVKYLVAKGVSVQAKDDRMAGNRYTMPVIEGHLEIVKYLVGNWSRVFRRKAFLASNQFTMRAVKEVI